VALAETKRKNPRLIAAIPAPICETRLMRCGDMLMALGVDEKLIVVDKTLLSN
jgi:hypothetical protein